jgi:hypothetical protein
MEIKDKLATTAKVASALIKHGHLKTITGREGLTGPRRDKRALLLCQCRTMQRTYGLSQLYKVASSEAPNLKPFESVGRPEEDHL